METIGVVALATLGSRATRHVGRDRRRRDRGVNAPAGTIATRIGCVFDPAKDMAAERPITQLPPHPGLGRARPQGPSGMTLPGEQTR
jgi:hypothetical protein